MRKLVFIFLCLISLKIFSQEKENNTRYFPVEYILKTSNDTIKGKVRNIGIFSNKKYSDMTILFDIQMLNDAGNKTMVKPQKIKYIKIQNPADGSFHEFFASTDKFGEEAGLVKVLFEGKKINWYKDYVNSALSVQVIIKGYLVDNNKNIIFKGFLDSSKNQIKKIFKQYPDLMDKVDSARTEEDYIKILQLYDAK